MKAQHVPSMSKSSVTPESGTVLAVFAHPDDMEFLCAGTLLHLADRGCKIHVATMTAGDCGSGRLSGAAIAKIRRTEARESARKLEAQYICLEQRDLSIFYDRRTLAKVTTLIRRVRPALVFTHSPTDYMVDHETTSRLVQTACFGSSAKNFKASDGKKGGRNVRATPSIPHLYYAEPFGGRDILGNAVPSTLWVNTTEVIGRQLELLACHKSQREWLDEQQGIDDYLNYLRRRAEERGRQAGTAFAEGFRQHRGNGFPQEGLLGTLLGDLAMKARSA